jgi:hypothetical protein
VAGFCEHGDGPSGSIRKRDIFFYKEKLKEKTEQTRRTPAYSRVSGTVPMKSFTG